MIHKLKTWPKFYASIADGTKTFEYRKNDRNFKVGDHILLREYCPKLLYYTGKMLNFKITFVLTSLDMPSIHPDYCIFSIEKLV